MLKSRSDENERTRTKRGVLERVSPPRSAKARKRGMKWLVIDGEFYTMFGELPEGLSPGDEVIVQFVEEEGEDKKRYRRVRELLPIGIGKGASDLDLSPEPERGRDRDRLIYRSVCLKAAAGAPFVKSGEEIIALAQQLEQFLYEAVREEQPVEAGRGVSEPF